MDIEIKRLNPALSDDYLHFFDVTPHDDDTPGSKCYCVCWCSADHTKPVDFSSQEKRRALAETYIRGGIIDGNLAYLDGKVVGWCNANTKSDCQSCISWLRFMPKDEKPEILKIKSVFCFVVAPDMQRRGIASALLERVCRDAAQEGFDAVEGYPNKAFVSAARDFMGPLKMFEKAGFTLYDESSDKLIMRKYLR